MHEEYRHLSFLFFKINIEETEIDDYIFYYLSQFKSIFTELNMDNNNDKKISEKIIHFVIKK